jgi:hypothetical protein
MAMSFSDEILMAYADGELDPDQRAAVERAMAADSDIARRIAEHKALRDQLRNAYAPVLKEEIPGRLLESVRDRPDRSGDNVIPLHRQASRARPVTWQWTAIAASLLLGVVIGQLTTRLGSGGPITARDGQLFARGTLANALDRQLASDQDPNATVWMGISYVAKDGTYCRTFTLNNRSALAGLACRDPQDWQVQMLMRSTSKSEEGAQYRRAASALPDAIAQAVEAQMSGAPLDARGEAVARSNGWRRERGH